MAISAENIRDDVVGNMANRADISDAIIYRYITYAQRRVSRLRAFNELSSETVIRISTAGTDVLLWSAGTPVVDERRIRRVVSIIPLDFAEDVWKRPLRRVSSVREWNMAISGESDTLGDAAQGPPTHYLWELMTELKVRPYVDKTYDLFVNLILYPADVTETNKTDQLSLFQAEDLIMFLTTAMLFARTGRMEDSSHYFILYKGSVDEWVEAEPDSGDFDMAAIRAVKSSPAVADYWKDPFFNQRGSSEQV